MNEKALPLTMTGLAIVMAAISGGGFFIAKGAMDRASALETQLEQTAKTATSLAARVDELDAGMVALVKVSGVDGGELRKVMDSELAEMRKTAVAEESVALEEAKVANEPPALSVQVVEPEMRPVAAQSPTSASAKQSVDATPAPASAAAPAVAATSPKAPESGADFEAIVKSLQSDPAQTAPTNNQQEEKKPTRSLTIAEVDGILAKRISEQWHKPASATDKMTVDIHIKMARDGKLDKVNVTRSSGLEVFDRSAVTALKSIGVVKEVAQLDDATFDQGYRSRTIQLR